MLPDYNEMGQEEFDRLLKEAEDKYMAGIIDIKGLDDSAPSYYMTEREQKIWGYLTYEEKQELSKRANKR